MPWPWRSGMGLRVWRVHSTHYGPPLAQVRFTGIMQYIWEQLLRDSGGLLSLGKLNKREK